MRVQKDLWWAVKEDEKGKYSELFGHLLCESGQSPSRVPKSKCIVILSRAVKHVILSTSLQQKKRVPSFGSVQACLSW